MRWDVVIPNWQLGQYLRIAGIEAGSPGDAYAHAVAVVNKVAGDAYCTKLPRGTEVKLIEWP